MIRKLAIWLSVSAVLLFSSLAMVSAYWLTTTEGGAFDGRVLGYDAADVLAYVDSLTRIQARFYGGLFQIADTVLQLLLLGSMVLWAWYLRGERVLFWLTILGAVVYYISDVVEGRMAVRLLADAGQGQVSDGILTIANLATQLKFAGLLAAMALLGWQAWRART